MAVSASNWRSMDEEQLGELFRKLGAPMPEGWARSQIKEGFPQLARYLFLRQAWRLILSPDDRSWISNMRPKNPDQPGGEFGPAMDRLLAAGARPEDLTTIARIMQWWLLSGLCVLLEDPGNLEPEVADVEWGLFLLDENYNPVDPIDGLIESLLFIDPTGREMRPPQT
jgi:hypothetical protein